MPNPINSASCGDGYTDACAILDVFKSNGGTFDIANASVFYQLQYGTRGDTHLTDEILARPGAGAVLPGTTGIQFRNAVAGQVAVVSAFIAPLAQPFAQVAATASAQTAPSDVLTGIVAANGTITAGSGFTVNHSGAGVYVITYTTAFAAAPVVLVTLLSSTTNVPVWVNGSTASGCTVTINGGIDSPFNFTAQAVA